MAHRKENKCVGVDMVEESNRVYTNKKATVEVTVKVKKRRHPSKHREQDGHQPEVKTGASSKIVAEVFRKGSWGDILSKNKAVGGKEVVVKEWKSKKNAHELMKCCEEGGDDSKKSLCHKIPLTSELYLETHTHVRSNKSSATTTTTATQYQEPKKILKTRGERAKSASSTKASHPHQHEKGDGDDEGDGGRKKLNYEAQNDYLRYEIDRLRKQIEHVNVQLDTRKKSPLVNDVAVSTSIIKKVGVPINKTERDLEKDLKIRRENEELRKQAAGLLAEMQKTKQEQHESIMTIKELYQLAELLKMENHKLIGAQEEQQQLQEKLVSAVSENHELKQYLDMIKKQKDDSLVKKDIHLNQLEKIRNVIHEVKSTIQEEIATTDSAALAYRESLRGLDLNITEGESALLNDTNASEIQRILGSYDDSRFNTLKSLEALDEIKGYLTPPSIMRTSTPEQASASFRRENEASSLEPNEDLNKVMGSFEEDLSRSFRPIQLDLAHSSSSSKLN